MAVEDLGSMEEWIKEADDKSDRCRPFFHNASVLQPFESEKQGRKIYATVPFVRIEIPGESKLRPDRMVEDEDKRRWPKSWAHFVQTQAQLVEGTPLEGWMTGEGENERQVLLPGLIDTLKAAGVRTIEDIAGLPDSAIQILGANPYKVRERARVAVAPPPSREKELLAENVEMKRRMEALEAKLLQLTAQPAPAPAPPPQTTAPVRKRAA